MTDNNNYDVLKQFDNDSYDDMLDNVDNNPIFNYDN